MIIKETKLKGCYIIEPTVFEDSRGLFFESYNKREFESGIGQSVDFVQDNQSISNKGVLRGLHYQKGEAAQAKLIRVMAGEVIDVVVDIRRESPTYGQYVKTRLSAAAYQMIFIPRGMAHGFLALEDDTIFTYKCDNYYDKQSESGIIYNDTNLNIDWEVPDTILKISDKDLGLPQLKDLDQ